MALRGKPPPPCRSFPFPLKISRKNDRKTHASALARLLNFPPSGRNEDRAHPNAMPRRNPIFSRISCKPNDRTRWARSLARAALWRRDHRCIDEVARGHVAPRRAPIFCRDTLAQDRRARPASRERATPSWCACAIRDGAIATPSQPAARGDRGAGTDPILYRHVEHHRCRLTPIDAAAHDHEATLRRRMMKSIQNAVFATRGEISKNSMLNMIGRGGERVRRKFFRICVSRKD